MGADSGIPFGNYALLRRIARGGMAEVFVARQMGIDGFDRLVAIKRILPHLLDDKSFVGMFQDEARLAARLSHPNIVHIYDFGKVEEHFFIAMQFMHGVHAGDLIRLAEDVPMPTTLVARIGADACAGLHYAHNRRDETGAPLKLVHRDVSPPNLLVSYDGVVKIVDFGIAKAVSSIEQTRPGVVKGKYAYMSPEQTMGQPLDGRSDVFSLAIVLWELLAGLPAVTRSDQVMAMKTIRDGKVPAVEEFRKDVPKALASAIRGALQKDPKKRSDARAFGNQLESFIKSSSEIATGMELGAWLTERCPPEDVVGAEETGFGTRQATMATSLKPSGTVTGSALYSELSELDISKSAAALRGAIVAGLPGVPATDQQETRVLAMSGNVKAKPARQGTASAQNVTEARDSVLIDSDLIARSNHTYTTKVLTPHDVFTGMPTSELEELNFDENAPTSMVMKRAPEVGLATKRLPLLSPVISGNDPDLDALGSPTVVDDPTPPPALEFVDNDLTYEEHQAPATSALPSLLYPPSPPVFPGLRPSAMQANAIQANGTQANAVQANAIQANAIQANAIQANGTQANAVQATRVTNRRFPVVWVGGGAVVIAAIFIAMSLGSGKAPPATAPGVSRSPGELRTPASAAKRVEPPVRAIVVTSLVDAGTATEFSANANQADAGHEDVDAGVVPEPESPTVRERKIKANRRRKRPQQGKKGRLVVKTSPYSVVYHRGRKLGTTPMANVALPPGRYRLTFKNPKFENVTRTAVIRSGETTKLDFALAP